MENKIFSFSYAKTAVYSSDELQKHAHVLKNVYQQMQHALKGDYASAYAIAFVPQDSSSQKEVLGLAQKMIQQNPVMLVVIGIGGSSLGARAIDYAVRGKCTHDKALSVEYVDNIDPDEVNCVYRKAEKILAAGQCLIINVVTKSGTTLETYVNFALFFELLKKYHPDDCQKYIVFTTEKDSPLYHCAHTQGFHCLSIPPVVSGRFSVFTPAGLFPLALMGVDIQELCAGAASMVHLCTSQQFDQNIAAQSACLLYTYYQHGINIHNLFVFSHDLLALGAWYRQLLAESIGKKVNNQKKEVNVGITPLVSLGTTDLHSLVQLHLSGQQNTATTFLFVGNTRASFTVPEQVLCQKMLPFVQGMSLGTIFEAIQQGVQKAYTAAKHPYATVLIPEKRAWFIGQWMQWKMFEIAYLGALFDINPFVQPEVELYKKETRDVLNHG